MPTETVQSDRFAEGQRTAIPPRYLAQRTRVLAILARWTRTLSQKPSETSSQRPACAS